jgi:hypothetical protein
MSASLCQLNAVSNLSNRLLYKYEVNSDSLLALKTFGLDTILLKIY